MTAKNELDRVMIDLETLGTEPGCSILSIGAVRFNEDGVTDDAFHRSISLKSCEAAGLEIDAETLGWWLGRNAEAQTVLSGGDDLKHVLEDFSVWYDQAVEVWAYSPQFDCAILSAAYDAVDILPPWSYRDERCARTLSNLPVANDVEHDGVDHDALDDAVNQAEMVAKTLRQLDREVLQQ